MVIHEKKKQSKNEKISSYHSLHIFRVNYWLNIKAKEAIFEQ